MSKVITFSRYFQKGHIREGQETFFGVKLIQGIKHHTIRKGNRWNAGDMFSPRQWSGIPYKSKQIKICDDIKIESVWHIAIINGHFVYIDRSGKPYCLLEKGNKNLNILANNDGLVSKDFISWFDKYPEFIGQIICWNKEIKY